MMPRDAYTNTSILIVGSVIIDYISAEFIFEEKRLNEISKNKFSSKITHYTIYLELLYSYLFIACKTVSMTNWHSNIPISLRRVNILLADNSTSHLKISRLWQPCTRLLQTYRLQQACDNLA